METKLIIYCGIAIFLGIFFVSIPILPLVAQHYNLNEIRSEILTKETENSGLNNITSFYADSLYVYLGLILFFGGIVGIVTFYAANKYF
ncbi:MAG: hypothetical protein JSV20_10130 [Candidatus Bathyarchaeota archaeon]|nr:MAG: hypothetical protein JSV20_10130 [Candidatus Bathyarchaeota archaeon]